MWGGEVENFAEKIYYLNKILHSIDLFYEVELPSIFFFDHPLGSVMGRAKYSDYFSFLQGCTVGNNKGKYPIIGRNVSMLSNSKILGDCHIGNNVILSANSYVIDTDIPDNSIVFGQGRNITIKTYDEETMIKRVENVWKVEGMSKSE